MRLKITSILGLVLLALISTEAGATSYLSRDYYSAGDDCLYQLRERSISGEVVLGTDGLVGGDNCDGEFGGLPYIIESNITIESTGVLRIEPGVTVRFKDGPCNFTVYGTLIAEDVLFASDNVPPFPGDWSGIRLSGTNAAHSQFTDCAFEYGGASQNEVLAFVQCEDGADISIEGCEFRYSGHYGILTDGASPDIIGCTFSHCELFPIYQRSLDSFPNYDGNTFIENKHQGVLLGSGTIPNSGTWQNPGIPYVVSMFGGNGLLEIPRDVTLVLEAGTIVKFINNEGRLDVLGVLRAEGTPLQAVAFTSYANDWAGGDSNGDGDETSPAPGDFSAIRFLSGDSAASYLTCCMISYGGQGRAGTASVYLSLGANVTFNTCLIDHSADVGLKAINAYPQLLGCFFIANETAVLCTSGAQPALNHCSFYDNGYAVINESYTKVVGAQNCYWGHESGPFDNSDDTASGGFYNPFGQGDPVSDGVDYRGFLDEAFWGPTFSIRTNSGSFTTGDQFRLLAGYASLQGEMTLDAYIAFVFPSGDMIFYPDLGVMPTPIPLWLPAFSAVPEFGLWEPLVPGGIPLGEYSVLAAGFWPGTFDFVTNLAGSSFEIY
ncbi:MAG: right-handed parallel beta-helix repeat-containing protein [Candidatus Coatesbacteria bacterium]|nr:right-handed parallel beta-helix repeat-containing protein [Candidatus Coatesbacteria bacterium]